MVSVRFSTHIERSDRLYQSVDIAVRDLLEEQRNPLALAFYLWTVARHKHSLINTSNLVSWGVGWVRHIFVEGHLSRRRDEEIASASLVCLALSNTSALSPVKSEACEGIKRLLADEMERHNVPFRRPDYGALFLMAAHQFGINELPLEEASRRTGCAFVDVLPGGRLFGLIYGAQLLQTIKEFKCATSLEEAVRVALEDPGTDVEDHPYLLQALWQLRVSTKGNGPDDELMTITERLLSKTPMWKYLMNGMEDVPPAGDGRHSILMSHLYRAALLDVLLSYQSHVAARKAAQLDKKYQGRAGVNWSAFGFYALIFIIAWAVTLFLMIPSANQAGRYWIVGDFAAMRPISAILYLCGAILTSYLFIVTGMLMPTIYTVFVKSRIASDKRIKDILGRRLWSATKIWFAAIALVLLIGVVVNFITPGAQHLFKREAWLF